MASSFCQQRLTLNHFLEFQAIDLEPLGVNFIGIHDAKSSGDGFQVGEVAFDRGDFTALSLARRARRSCQKARAQMHGERGERAQGRHEWQLCGIHSAI